MEVLRYHTREPTTLDPILVIAVPENAFFLGLSSTGSVWMTSSCEILALDARGNMIDRKQTGFGSLASVDGRPSTGPFWANCAVPMPFAIACVVGEDQDLHYCRINLETSEAHLGPTKPLFSAWSPNGRFHCFMGATAILRQRYDDRMRPVDPEDSVSCTPQSYPLYVADDGTCYFQDVVKGCHRWGFGRNAQPCQPQDVLDLLWDVGWRLSNCLLRALATKNCSAQNPPTHFHPLVKASDSLCNLAIDSLVRVEADYGRVMEQLPDERCRAIAVGFRRWRFIFWTKTDG
jgi:hypothetical protein